MGSQAKTAIITGGNRGLGLAAAQKLAARGVRVLITARNAESGADAVESIRRSAPGASVECLPLDLASLASVRACAALVLARGEPLHILINNGGQAVYSDRPQFTPDGYERTFATNHLGHFLLTLLLLPLLRQSAPARVVTVSSQTILGKGGPKPDFDFANLRGEKYYSPTIFYRNSKLANMLFALELQRREGAHGLTSNAICPGFVPATIARKQKSAVASFMYSQVLARMPFARSIEQATDNYAYAATDPSLDGIGGKFIVDCKFIQSSPESYDEALAKRVWDLSEQMTGLAATA